MSLHSSSTIDHGPAYTIINCMLFKVLSTENAKSLEQFNWNINIQNVKYVTHRHSKDYIIILIENI